MNFYSSINGTNQSPESQRPINRKISQTMKKIESQGGKRKVINDAYVTPKI